MGCSGGHSGATADRSAAIALGVEIIKDIYEISAEGDTSISETLGMQLSQKALLLRSIDNCGCASS